MRLDGLSRELRKAVAREGLRVRRGLWGSAVHFDPLSGDVADNSQLVRILGALARLGFAFASDYKQVGSPEAIALDLRARGLFHGAVLSCGFDGSRWHVREVPADR